MKIKMEMGERGDPGIYVLKFKWNGKIKRAASSGIRFDQQEKNYYLFQTQPNLFSSSL